MFAIPENLTENQVVTIDGKSYQYKNGKLKRISVDSYYDMSNVLKNYVSTDGGKINGPVIGVKEKAQVLVAGTLDLNEGNLFTKTVTSDTTFTLTNISAIPNVVQSFILEITNGGNFIVTWWNNIKWDNGVMPELTVDGVDILGFYTSDNGNTWRGVLLSKDSK